MDGEGAALAEGDVVQVELENLVLGEARLEHHRHEPFDHLPLRRLVRRQERVLDQLLRDGAAARQVGLVAEDVAEDGAGDADRIDAGVVVEAAILDRQDRLDHLARDGLQRHVAALLASLGRDERRDERRVERDALDGLLVGRQLDGLDSRRLRSLRRPAAEDEPHGPALVVAVARDEHHRVAPDREFPRLLGAGAVRVAQIVQPIDQLALGEGLSPVQLERAGEHPRIGPRHLAAHPRVDHLREDDPVVRHRERQQDHRDADAEEGIALPARRQPEAQPHRLFLLARRRLGPRRGFARFSFDGRHRGSKWPGQASLVRRRTRPDGSQAHCILPVNGSLHDSSWNVPGAPAAVRSAPSGGPHRHVQGFGRSARLPYLGHCGTTGGGQPPNVPTPNSQRPIGS